MELDSSLSALADSVREEGVAPNVALGFAVRSFGGWLLRTGGDDTSLFDLASLTKPMFATACVRAGFAPGERLSDLLPSTAGSPVAQATVADLLSHRSGLGAHVPLYLTCAEDAFQKSWPNQISRGRAIELAAASVQDLGIDVTPLPALYSDLGYMLLGEAISHTRGLRDAGQLIEREIVARLQLDRDLGSVRSLLAADANASTRFVPTEMVDWRGGKICGAVHDENAWALTGTGASGHAGMFGTVESVLRFAVHVIESRQDYNWLLKTRPGGTLRAGFDGKSEEGSSAGSRMSKTAVGHLGFTGTSFWIDFEQGVVVSLLTNRVNPSRDNQKIKEARPRVHDRLFEIALQTARSSFR
ncbi:MAG: beta-lactamase family protein [Polyangiaceae bacterium]|nr:beta-lactamase family protein [Polyangiaceae bacterium]